MSESLPFGSHEYFLMLALLFFGRSMDFFSTWVATPNLSLEGNPIAKKLGWRWGALVNIGICVGMARWPITAIAISVTSVLVAARNFQSAWLMRSMGEEHYRHWHVNRIQETPITLYLSCLAGNTLLTAAVGVAVMYFSNLYPVPLAIGMGIITYAIAVAFYSLLGVWRLRRAADRRFPRVHAAPAIAADRGVEGQPGAPGAAEQLVDRLIEGLALEVPERNVECCKCTGQRTLGPELGEGVEQRVEQHRVIERVLADQRRRQVAPYDP